MHRRLLRADPELYHSVKDHGSLEIAAMRIVTQVQSTS